jgi:hypothetical protein
MIRGVIVAAVVASSAGCGSLFSSDTIETATEAARAACRAIARDYTPELLALLERIASIAESDQRCPHGAAPLVVLPPEPPAE